MSKSHKQIAYFNKSEGAAQVEQKWFQSESEAKAHAQSHKEYLEEAWGFEVSVKIKQIAAA